MPNKYKEGTKQIPLRVTEELKDAITRASGQAGQTTQDYIRDAIRQRMERENVKNEENEKKTEKTEGR